MLYFYRINNFEAAYKWRGDTFDTSSGTFGGDVSLWVKPIPPEVPGSGTDTHKIEGLPPQAFRGVTFYDGKFSTIVFDPVGAAPDLVRGARFNSLGANPDGTGYIDFLPKWVSDSTQSWLRSSWQVYENSSGTQNLYVSACDAIGGSLYTIEKYNTWNGTYTSRIFYSFNPIFYYAHEGALIYFLSSVSGREQCFFLHTAAFDFNQPVIYWHPLTPFADINDAAAPATWLNVLPLSGYSDLQFVEDNQKLWILARISGATEDNYVLEMGNFPSDSTITNSYFYSTYVVPGSTDKNFFLSTNTPAGVYGACCEIDDSCTIKKASTCIAGGGIYQGDGTTCTPGLCGGVTGACCLPDGTCSSISSESCSAAGGNYQGDGVNCSSVDCGYGACCYDTGLCYSLTEEYCIAHGGDFLGFGTYCEDFYCSPHGACCVGEICQDLTSDECSAIGGSYKGDGTSCQSANWCCPEEQVLDTCIEATVPYGDFYYSANSVSLDNLFSRVTTYPPPSSCSCLDDTTYTVTLDSRDCSSQSVDICGTIITVGSPEGRTVCCDQIGCFCSTICPPYEGSEECTPVPDCKCGIECIPVCISGEKQFSTLDAAINANWDHCKAHGTPVSGFVDCFYIDYAQSWEAPDIRMVCKEEIAALVESAWNDCTGGGQGDDKQACCLGNTCEDLSVAECLSRGGTPLGIGTNCSSSDCSSNCVSPVILKHPGKQRVQTGEKHQFSINVSGDSPFHFEWKKDGSTIPGETRITGINSSVLEILSTNDSDNGIYTCSVSNACGNTLSANGELSVISVPCTEITIVQQPVNHTVDYGTTASFSVNATGSPVINYQWKKDGVDLLNDFNYSGTNTSVLIISFATYNDVGTYSCDITNDCTETISTDSVTLTVDALPVADTCPTVTEQPSDQTVQEGQRAALFVSVSGSPTLRYRWQKNGVDVDSSIFGYNGALLIIASVRNSDEGDYSCIIENDCTAGTPTTSSSAKLSVIPPPECVPPTVLNQPISQTVQQSNKASFSANGSGTAPLSYQWQKEGSNLVDGGKISGATTSGLVIDDVSIANEGYYVCVITNECGSVISSEALLDISDAPQPPQPPPPPCDGCGGAGSSSSAGCGYWPPTNVDCNTDIIIGQDSVCYSVRNPDVLVLNNGIGLVAYEDTSDSSVIKIKQLHTSIQNKIRPNRTMRYGRLENPSKWTIPGGDFPSDSALIKLYYYEPIGDIATWYIDTQEKADILFFISGPFKNQVFTVYDTGIDTIGEYIRIYIPSTTFADWSWDYIKLLFPTYDDRYDVQWAIYDKSDTYEENESGNLIGTSKIASGLDPLMKATVEDNNSILSLPPHYYNGEKVPVAHPSIAHLDNYDNENENSHFVYVSYQALENKKWNVYLRQLRLSEYKKSSDVFLSESNLISLIDAGIDKIKWTCRVSCVKQECVNKIKTATITSVWTAKTTDGFPVYNMYLPLGSLIVCGQLFSKNILTIVLTQQTTWIGEDSECPDITMVMGWKNGDEITTSVPVFNSILDQSEIDNWANTEFTYPIENMPINSNVSSNLITSKLIYHSTKGGGWGVFTDNIVSLSTKYKGIYLSDPILVYNNETGHCTNPVVQTDYANRIFVSFESVENGLQQIRICGTAVPENSLPIGNDSGWVSNSESFDKVFNFFYMPDSFVYNFKITETGINQHPRIWIDLNNVVHLTWHSNRDNKWEIYYANSDTSFRNTRITNFDSKSLNPDICGDNNGKLFIVWHDNRFGPWEIMAASFDGSRILPLFQQNEYLASLRNNYTHSINIVPIIVSNLTSSSFCFSDLVVNFFENRDLISPVFTIRKSDYPFAFSEANENSGQYTLVDEYCIQPGEEKEFILTLTPEIFINPKLTSSTELPIGLKQNKTYFTSVRVILDSGETKEMPPQQQSVSCTDCTGIPMKYDYSSCSVLFNVTNEELYTKYINAKVSFYTDADLINKVDSISSLDDLSGFAIDGQLASSLWNSGGLKLDSGKTVNISYYPSLSKNSGLLCGYSYYVLVEISYSDSKITPSSSYSSIGDPVLWRCNCQSVRWGEEEAISIRDVYRWQSSGFGYSDTRMTISPGNSLNPIIRFCQTNKGVILFQDDRLIPGEYQIYGSVFVARINENMRASGTMVSSDISDARSLIWPGSGASSEFIKGQNLSFDTDLYGNIFLAYENNQKDNFIFNDDTQSSISVHKCGFNDPENACTTPATLRSYYILGINAPDDLMSYMTKNIRIKNNYVKYHITRNSIPTAVVSDSSIVFNIIGSPETIAIRLKNEDTSVWSVWIPFEPLIGNYQTEIPWNLSTGSGLKRTYFQLATYQGTTTTAYIDIVADYESVQYEMILYSGASRTNDVVLPYFNQIPVASVIQPESEQTEQIIYIDIIPSIDYLNKFKNPSEGSPVFSVFTQGNEDIINEKTEYVNTEGRRVYQGSFKIYKTSETFSQDGLAMIVPNFSGQSYISLTEIDKFNIIKEATKTEELERDSLGNVPYRITSRPSEDPMIAFGDPDYRLYQE